MKKGRSLFVAGVLFMSFSVVFGQGDYAFKVLANKGTNEVKSGDTWVAIKTGAAIQKGDQLRLSENSYVGLVSNEGKPLELKTSGIHMVAELLAKVKATSNTSVLNKYTDFILSSNSAEAKKNRLSATGAVSRGSKEIRLYLPENNNSDVLNSTVFITWEKDHGPYVVSFKNMFDDELAVIETPETSVQVNLAAREYANESAILVEVKSKADGKVKSPQRLLKKLTPAQADKIKKDMAELGTTVSDQTPLNQFIMAGFYEEKKLIIDALGAYEQAIKMAPDVPSYKEAYEEFLLRNKLKVAQNP